MYSKGKRFIIFEASDAILKCWDIILFLDRNGLFKLHHFMWDKHVFKCTSELNTSVVVSTAGLVLLWCNPVPWTSLCSLEPYFCTCRNCCVVQLKPTFPGRSETSCLDFCSLWVRGASAHFAEYQTENRVKTTGWYFRLSLGHRVLIKVMPRKSISSHCWVNTQHYDFNLFVLSCVYNVMVSTLCLKPLPLAWGIISDIRKRL